MNKSKLFLRILCLVLAAILCLGLLAGIAPAISAASLVNYQYGSGSYSNYIYNWGARGTLATFLSPKAEAFYADNNVTYDELAALSGSSNTSGVPSSALYRELRDLMVSNHDYETSYDATKNLFQFTDCQNGGGKISSFYTGAAIGPAWDGGWNREHTWPNSKGDDNGNGENDLIMLRPTTTSENSSRGNTAYGQSSGYYNPNTPSNNTYDLRGDVARVMLFVYVRWRAVSSTDPVFGTDGVIESKDVLLDWMAADPVDTWEMGRNDAAESITGTRNVFVDYPELAFALFNEGIPATMATPSGEAQGNGYTITAQIDDPAKGSATVTGRVITVTPAEGYALTGYTVTSGTAEITRDGNRLVVNASSDCTVKLTFSAKTPATVTLTMNGATANTISTYVGDTVILPGYLATTPADHTFAGWVTADVAAGSSKPATVYTTGSSYTVTGNAELKALYSVYDPNAGSTGNGIYTKITDLNELTTGQYVMILDTGYAPLVLDGSWITAAQPVVAGNTISDTQNAVWTITVDGTSASLTDANGVSIKPAGGNNNGISSGTTPYQWTVSCTGGKFTFGGNGTDTVVLASNVGQANKFRAYKTATATGSPAAYPYQFTLYKPSAGGYTYTTAVEGFTPEELTYTTIAQAVSIGEAMADQTFTTEKYYVSGIITEIENTTFGNLYIADADGNVLKIYGTYDATGTNKYEALAVKPKVGDTVVLYGILGNYGGEAEMKDAWIMDHTVGDGSNLPNVPTTTITLVTAPEADTAYKFGLTQVNKDNAVYYLNGKMANTYYLGTTEAPKSGVDVYLEETTGGYYLYAAINGARKYLNMTVSGTHVNGVYADTAATVYTYDAEKMTMVATVNDAVYAFGTYDAYTTAGPIKADDGFFCNFYILEGSTGEMPPVNPNPNPDPDPDPDPNPDAPEYVADPVVGTGYKLAMDHITEGKRLYMTDTPESATTTYRFQGSEDAEDGLVVYLEEVAGVSGGYRMYYMDGSTKTYIRVYEILDGTKKKGRTELTTTMPDEYFTYDSTFCTLVYTTAAGDSYYMGSYNAYVTFSVSSTSFLTESTVDVTQYPARFYALETQEPPIEPAKNGWVLEGGKWFFYEDGEMIKNAWRQDSKGWCFLGADGAMLTNQWKKDSKGWCYIGSSGYIVYSKWVKDSVGWCYVGADGYMVYNKWVKDSVGWCYVGADGYMVYNKWVKDSKGWCYVDASGYMVYNKWVADSKGWCYVDGSGYMVTNGWAKDSLGWYWMGADGYAIKNTSKTIGGKTYKFNASGLCTNP